MPFLYPERDSRDLTLDCIMVKNPDATAATGAALVVPEETRSCPACCRAYGRAARAPVLANKESPATGEKRG